MIDGFKIYNFAKKIFPICRSITGEGNRKTLKLISKVCKLKLFEIPTGTKCFDWSIPFEWNIKDAWIKDSSGKKIIDFTENNLHVVGYSIPVNADIKYSELKKKLYFLKTRPNSIPYVISYYKRDWGFCLKYNQLKKLDKKSKYKVFINSSLKKGSLTYGEKLFKGKFKKEIFFSTYICHPSLANNEVSGPSLCAFLMKYLENKKYTNFSYRFTFVPETIGSIAYVSKNLKVLKKNVIAGYNITCVGDDNSYSFLKPKYKNTIAEEIALHVLKDKKIKYKTYDFKFRGSDERQYSSPGVDLPFVSVMRSKYAEYPEYHNSDDNLNFISPQGFQGSFDIYTNIIEAIESLCRPKSIILCEPFMSKRNLRPERYENIYINENSKDLMDVLTYCDGINSNLDIANLLDMSIFKINELIKILKRNGVIKIDDF